MDEKGIKKVKHGLGNAKIRTEVSGEYAKKVN